MADPSHPTAEMRAHVATCDDCSEYTRRALRFESRLERALRVRVDAVRDAPAVPRLSGLAGTGTRRRLQRRSFAVAAGALLALVVVGGLWLGGARSSLAADVVDHMAEEPNAWTSTDVPVPQPKLDQVLAESNVRLKSSAGLVSYANSCLFRGHQVPHLVVQTAAGPVTVMVLTHEPVERSVRFDEHGYRGMIVPAPNLGSLAVLERGPSVDLKAMEAVAAQVIDAISWSPPAAR